MSLCSKFFFFFLCASMFFLITDAKTTDPYKVLGVERNASQREIQKAFHKLSLQYHPDKNQNKGAQAKFEEINNAYEILSDEEKRKNYDTYGDERRSPGFDASHSGDQGGYTYFTGGGSGNNDFTFRPGAWQNMGGQGSSQSFSFSFGNPSGRSSFGFDLNDIFSDIFGAPKGGGHFQGFGGSKGPQSGSSSPKSIRAINLQVYEKEIADQGMTWLLLSFTPTLKGNQYYESILEEVAKSLQGVLKIGSVNCETELSLCKKLGIYPRRAPRVFIHMYKSSGGGSLVEYNDDLVAKKLKSFCQEHMPKFSKRVDMKRVESFSGTAEKLPRLILLSTKKDTPVIWRALSGLYHKQFIFYDAEVHDVSDPAVKKLGVDSLPAIVGWLSNGEKHVLKMGISVKDLKSAIHDIRNVLDGFAKKNKKAASRQAKNAETESMEKKIPLLIASNYDALCGETTPVCVIGAFRSAGAREKLEAILSMVSQKSLSRQQNMGSGSRDSISYSLLDATKQSAFLGAFDKSGFKSLDNFVVAYKPRKKKFAAFVKDMTTEEVERFISSILSGDREFAKTRKKPVLR